MLAEWLTASHAHTLHRKRIRNRKNAKARTEFIPMYARSSHTRIEMHAQHARMQHALWTLLGCYGPAGLITAGGMIIMCALVFCLTRQFGLFHP